MSEVRQCVSLSVPAFVADLFVASSKRDRLERKESNLPRVVESKLDDASDLLIVYTVNDRNYGNDAKPRIEQVLNRAKLDVKQVTDATM